MRAPWLAIGCKDPVGALDRAGCAFGATAGIGQRAEREGTKVDGTKVGNVELQVGRLIGGCYIGAAAARGYSPAPGHFRENLVPDLRHDVAIGV